MLVKTYSKGLKPVKTFKSMGKSPKSSKLFIHLNMSTCLDTVLDQGLNALPRAKCVLSL